MENNNLENRIEYKTLHILKDMYLDYVVKHINPETHVYEGDTNILITFNKLDNELRLKAKGEYNGK